MDDSGFDLSYADSRVADSCTLSYESSGGYTRLFTIVRNDRRFIAKTLKPEFAASSVHIDLLRKEYLIGSSLYHPAIVSMAGFEVLADIGPSIVMEYVEGISLDRYLIDKTTLPEMQARKIAAQLCDAVGYIHGKQIIHRDLKPANIMVSADGACVKIIDFGLSDSSSYVNLKYRGGTPAFGAPEQFASTCDHRADIFSLGKI